VAVAIEAGQSRRRVHRDSRSGFASAVPQRRGRRGSSTIAPRIFLPRPRAEHSLRSNGRSASSNHCGSRERMAMAAALLPGADGGSKLLRSGFGP
jgi:hypothetical protein